MLSRYLYGFEMHEKAKEEGRPQTGRGARRRVMVQESDEDVIEDRSSLKLTKINLDGSNSNTTVNNKSMESSDLEVNLHMVLWYL